MTPRWRSALIAFFCFWAGVWLIVADEVFFWYGALGRNYYYWPTLGLPGVSPYVDVWTAWEVCWAMVALAFAGMTILAIVRDSK